MLAGVGLVLLLIGFGNSTTQTLAAISSISVQLERAMFFLALTSAAGSINKLCVDNACRFNGSRALVFYDVLTVCLYVTCVIFTILAAPVDEIMFHSSLRVPDWYIPKANAVSRFQMHVTHLAGISRRCPPLSWPPSITGKGACCLRPCAFITLFSTLRADISRERQRHTT
jgi:hypothetical protein